MSLVSFTFENQVPVFKGSKTPLLEPYDRRSEPFHGSDGLGDATFDGVPDVTARVTSEHASMALCRLVRENPGTHILAKFFLRDLSQQLHD
jgi:inosine-uridine nucleoside N-ribohydrolase